MRITVIVPFHRNLGQLEESLGAVRHSVPEAEVLVAADGAVDDCRALAARHDARVIAIAGPQGPATARNRAAAVATGDVLVFVDADVVVSRDAIPGMCGVLEHDPSVAAIFGAYDLQPRVRTLVSQFKNLSHSYVHEVGRSSASTFWAGLGAIRADAFRAVGGFDERFRRPSVEDIELGYRVVDAGFQIRLDPRFRACHLKHWTLWSCIVTDIRARGVPWMQLLLRRQSVANDLNTSTALRLSVVAAWLFVLSLLLLLVTPWALAVLVGSLGLLVTLNFKFYRWFARQRGLWFAVRTVPLHLVHHCCNGVSLAVGLVLHVATRLGLSLPGALPQGRWRQGTAAAGTGGGR